MKIEGIGFFKTDKIDDEKTIKEKGYILFLFS